MRRLLVTGFGPFANIKENPSEFYARALGSGLASDDDLEIVVRVLGVNEDSVAELVAFLRSNHENFDAVILLGVDPSSSTFKLEMLAKDTTPDDRISKIMLTTVCMSDGRWLDFLPDYSYDAGTYFCNRLYYLTLCLVYEVPCIKRKEGGHLLPVIFIHVPPFEAVPFGSGLERLEKMAALVIRTST